MIWQLSPKQIARHFSSILPKDGLIGISSKLICINVEFKDRYCFNSRISWIGQFPIKVKCTKANVFGHWQRLWLRLLLLLSRQPGCSRGQPAPLFTGSQLAINLSQIIHIRIYKLQFNQILKKNRDKYTSIYGDNHSGNVLRIRVCVEEF